MFIFNIWKYKFTYFLIHVLTYSGVIGKAMTDNLLRVWTNTVHRCAEISDCLKEINSTSNDSQTHKEMQPGRIKGDNTDFDKIQCRFRSHRPFIYGEHLVCLDSRLVDEKKQVNCDRLEEIGALIQKGLDGKNFDSCSFKRKDKIINLRSLYSSVIIEKEEIRIDPLTLFLRLALVVERKPEAEMENYFYYEMTPYPTSLFKDGAMRTPKNKVKLKSYLLEGNITSEGSDCIRVADGGALLCSCNWSTNKNLRKIFQKHIDKCLEKFDAVVFDGYISSTKDVTRKSR